MKHFTGVTNEERWKNDLLDEIRNTNQMLSQLLGHNAQMSDKEAVATNQTQNKPKVRVKAGA